MPTTTMDDDAVPFRVLSARDFDKTGSGHKRRPAHKKTRTGCSSCKARKVKVLMLAVTLPEKP